MVLQPMTWQGQQLQLPQQLGQAHWRVVGELLLVNEHADVYMCIVYMFGVCLHEILYI